MRALADLRFNGGDPVIVVESLGYMRPAEAFLFAEELVQLAREASPAIPLLGREYRWRRVVRHFWRSRDELDRARDSLAEMVGDFDAVAAQLREAQRQADELRVDLAAALVSANHWKQARESCMAGAEELVRQRDELRAQLGAAESRASHWEQRARAAERG